MVFTSRDAAMSTANQVARKRQVSIWMIAAGGGSELVRTYRNPKK
jgi:hypothetical protein